MACAALILRRTDKTRDLLHLIVQTIQLSRSICPVSSNVTPHGGYNEPTAHAHFIMNSNKIFSTMRDISHPGQNDVTTKKNTIFEAKTSLGALSKHFMRIELDLPVTLGSVTLVRVKSARVTAIWIGDRCMKNCLWV